MRVACPSCDATYDIPDHLLGSHRKLRCARCSAEWVLDGTDAAQAAPVHAPEQPPRAAFAALDMPPADSAMDRLARQSARSRRPTLALRLAWAGSVAALLLLLGACIIWRDVVARAWPPSERVLWILGPPRPPGP